MVGSNRSDYEHTCKIIEITERMRATIAIQLLRTYFLNDCLRCSRREASLAFSKSSFDNMFFTSSHKNGRTFIIRQEVTVGQERTGGKKVITVILITGIAFTAGVIAGAGAVVAWAWYESDKPDKRKGKKK
jgi:hypothetical protein